MCRLLRCTLRDSHVVSFSPSFLAKTRHAWAMLLSVSTPVDDVDVDAEAGDLIRDDARDDNDDVDVEWVAYRPDVRASGYVVVHSAQQVWCA
jgi:hypothetical protein